MNVRTIAAALAATIGTLTSNGETATATASLPNNVGTLALLVYPPSGDLGHLMGAHLNARLTFPVKLLRDPFSVPQRTDALYDWATVLWPKGQSVNLNGVAGVVEAEATTIRIEIDGEKYASVDGVLREFDVVELTVEVHVYESETFGP